MKQLSLILISILIPFLHATTFAQSIDALGTVWSKEYGAGTIRNIKPVKYGGGYVACGNKWNAATTEGVARCEGLLIEIDESGNELRRASAFPDSYIDSHTTAQMEGAEAWFIAAFKTNDGGYLAFGQLTNSTAPRAEKEFQWPNSPYGSPELINGTWIVRFDESLNVVKNVLVKGRRIYDGWQTEDDNFAVAGHQAAPNQGAPATKITMLRKYDGNGELLIPDSHDDTPIDLGFVLTMYKYPGIDKFIATTTWRVLGIDNAMDVSDTMELTSAIVGGGSNIYTHSLSPTV